MVLKAILDILLGHLEVQKISFIGFFTYQMFGREGQGLYPTSHHSRQQCWSIGTEETSVSLLCFTIIIRTSNSIK